MKDTIISYIVRDNQVITKRYDNKGDVTIIVHNKQTSSPIKTYNVMGNLYCINTNQMEESI